MQSQYDVPCKTCRQIKHFNIPPSPDLKVIFLTLLKSHCHYLKSQSPLDCEVAETTSQSKGGNQGILNMHPSHPRVCFFFFFGKSFQDLKTPSDFYSTDLPWIFLFSLN